jgi:hypothetical protein
MTWAKLAKPVNTTGTLQGVSVGIKPERRAKPRLWVRIALAVLRDAGLPAQSGSPVDVMIGEGDDAGRMKIASAVRTGAFPLKARSARVMFAASLGVTARLVATPRGSAPRVFLLFARNRRRHQCRRVNSRILRGSICARNCARQSGVTKPS